MNSSRPHVSLLVAAGYLCLSCSVANADFSSSIHKERQDVIAEYKTDTMIVDLIFCKNDSRLISSHLNGNLTIWDFMRGKAKVLDSKQINKVGIRIAGTQLGNL